MSLSTTHGLIALMRYVIVTGEASGDQIGAAIALALKVQDPNAQIYAMGGQELIRAGADIVQDHTDLAVMGLTSLPKKLIQIRRAYHQLRSTIDRIRPDVIVYVDFAGFNLKLGRWTKSKRYKNIYIAPPKTWASRDWRNRAIRRDFDLLITLFPFAHEYFLSQGLNSQFYGHPLVSSLRSAKANGNQNSSILLAPGSRVQEIESIMPILRELIVQSPQHNFVVSKISNLSPSIYSSYLEGVENVTLSEEALQNLLPQAQMAIITSGTATLEAAIIGVPQVVIYRTSSLNYFFAKKLIKTKYISLPNLILDKTVVPELIQAELTSTKLIEAMATIGHRKKTIQADYTQIKEFYNQINPSEQIASAILDLINR